MSDADDLLTTADVAALTTYKESTLRWLRHQGKGPRSFALRPRGRVVYRRSDVTAWLDEARTADPRTA